MLLSRSAKKRLWLAFSWTCVVLVYCSVFNVYISTRSAQSDEKDGEELCASQEIVQFLKLNDVGNGSRRQCWRLISVKSSEGRLGNNLFQYASLYGCAKRYNYVPVVSQSTALLRSIDATRILAKVLPDEKWRTVKWYRWFEPLASSYNRIALEKSLQGDRNVLLERYLQSFRYFEGYEAEVVSQFVFSEAVLDWAHAALQKVKARMPRDQPNSTIVGVHIRRGDYLLNISKQQGYNTPEQDYYVNAMRYFTDRYAFVAFIVACTELEWAANLIDQYFPSSTTMLFELTFASYYFPERDLALLSLANHSILSAGTYSFWSAMLRQYRSGVADNGTTIYYTKPFIPNTEIANSYDNNLDNYYPSHWIGMH